MFQLLATSNLHDIMITTIDGQPATLLAIADLTWICFDSYSSPVHFWRRAPALQETTDLH
jgi:hypothetical protein